MKKFFITVCLACLATTGWADELAEIKIALAIAEVRTQRLESMLQVEPETEIKPIVNPVITPPRPQFTTRQEVRTKEVLVPAKWCNGRVCAWKRVQQNYTVSIRVPVTDTEPVEATASQSVPISEDDNPEQYASPPDVIERVLTDLAIQPNEVFLDIGSGDGRAVIAAAKRFGCRAIGIEQDPQRIALAQANAAQAGVSHLVSFIQGDFNTVEWPRADVGYAYLFPEDLSGIRNKLLSLDRFVTFAHKVPNLEMYNLKGGDTYLWDRDRVFAWWNGRAYTAPPCNRSNCSMCNSIKASLYEQRSHRD